MNYTFEDSLIKFEVNSEQFSTNSLYDFSNTTYFNQVYLNSEADYTNVVRHDFRIGASSFARDKANLETTLLVPLDILGNDRTVSPDIGAFEITMEN